MASTQLFLYEPEVIPRLAALVDPQNELPGNIVSGSLYALDALGRYRSKLNEVLSSLNASVNHGILLQILRDISKDLGTGTPTRCDEYVDAYFGLVSFITSTNVGSGLVVGAGLLQLLIKLIDQAKPESYMIQRSTTRAIGLLDSVIYAYVPAFTLFCQAHGLEIFVRRIEEEIRWDVEAASANMDDREDVGPDHLFGKLTFGRAHLLRAFLQSISHMMVSTGTADGLRNLIDTSLLASIKTIMEKRRIIGPQNLALAIGIMATFVHNEPTSLGIIQEKRLPETFLALVNEDVEAQFDVINAIPNAIGALCLNQAGLDMFNSEPMIDRLLSLLTSERHVKVFQDQDNVTVFGASIDELVRHQPSMKQVVMDGIFKVLDAIQAAGHAYEAPITEKVSMYQLSLVEHPPEQAGHDEDGAIVQEHTMKTDANNDPNDAVRVTRQSMALADVIMDEADVYNRKDDALKEPNTVASYMDVTARFLEVLFQSSNHCKDFLRADGLDKLLSFYNLPCLSYNFASTVTADSMVHLLRYISEINPTSVITTLLREVRSSLEETKPLWSQTDQVSALAKLLKPATEQDLADFNAKFRQLIKLNARVQLLSDVAPTFTYSGSKTPTTLLQVLNTTPSIMAGNRDVATINDLGDFQRAWTWETILFKAATHAFSKAIPLPEATKVADTEQAATDSPLSAPLFGVQNDHDVQTSSTPDPNDPLAKNTVALRYIASQVKVSLGSFFMETNRLLSTRRAHDSTHKRFATLTATQLGGILKANMIWKAHAKMSLSCDYMMVMVAQAAKLLYEERPTQVTHAQTIALVPFVRQGGLAELLQDYERCSSQLEQQYAAEETNGASSVIDDTLHACGALQMTLDLLLKMVNHVPLLESPSTQTMKSKEGVSKDSVDYFEPRAFLINLRLTIVPTIRGTWMKQWLTSVNFSITQSVLRTILRIAEGLGEVATTPATRASGLGNPISAGADTTVTTNAVPSSHPPAALMGLAHALGAPVGGLSGGGLRQRSTVIADEGRMGQLVDMGFGRRAARHALLRCSNNLSAATEFLLMHPEVASSMRGDDDQEEGDAAPIDRQAEASGDRPLGTSDESVEATEPPANIEADAEPGSTVPTGSESQQVDTPMVEPATAAVSTREQDEEAPMHEREKEAAPVDTPDELSLLNKERDEIMQTLLSRAFDLTDKFTSLVFDVRNAVRIATKSYTDIDPLKGLFEAIESAAPASLDDKMQFVSVRLHLLALIFNDHSYSLRFSTGRAKQFMQSLVKLMEQPEGEPRKDDIPSWLASYLLVLSAILRAEDSVPMTKMVEKEEQGEQEMPRIWTESTFAEEMPRLLEYSLQKLSQCSRLQRGDLLALYRFLVIVTRRPGQAAVFLEKGGLTLLLRPLSSMDFKEMASCRPYAILVMRHVIESNAEILRATVSQEIRSFFSQSRLKVMDTSSVTKSLGAVILREPDIFLDVMKSNIELVDYRPSQNQGILRLPDAPRTDTEPASSSGGLPGTEQGRQDTQGSGFLAPLEQGTDESMELVPPSPTKQGADLDDHMLEARVAREKESAIAGGSLASPASLDAVVHLLLAELLKTTRERSSKAPPSGLAKVNGSEGGRGEDDARSTSSSDASYFYICFLLQSLTELLSSYKACKTSFLNFTKKRTTAGATSLALSTPLGGKRDKAKQSGSALMFFFLELVPLGFLQSREHEEMRRLMSISNWAMSTIVALCADVVPITVDVKEVSSEVVFARKSVLDGITKAIKEATIQILPGRAEEGIESRYGRLYSLSDLCYRLLKARPTTTSAGASSARSMDDLSLHMAKTMLERNFVTVLTSALAEVDLNLPMVKSLLDRILKPLEYLTKVAIKMNKAERKNDKRKAEQEQYDSDDLESMDEDEMDEEEEIDEEGGEEGREETPDFYRNSSLGMHTGDLENQVSYDDDEDDEDEDEEMDEEMEGVTYSDDDTGDSSDDDDIDEEHIVEVMEEDDEDDESDDGSEDSDEELDDEDEAGWIDEDEDGDESEELDFIIDGDAEEAQRLLQQADQIFQTAEDGGDPEEDDQHVGAGHVDYDVHEVDGDDDEEGDEMDDEDESALEEIFEHDDLPNMQAPLFSEHAPMDRFGANWSWTNAAPPTNRARHREAETMQNHSSAGQQIISPFAFLGQRPSNSRQSRTRRMNWDDALEAMAPRGPHLGDARLGNFYDGRRAANDDVASHPLLTQAPSQSDLHGAGSSRLGRHQGLRRGGRGEDDGYQGWAQSLEGLMESGAMQFLETLLHRNGAGQGGPGPGEAIHISLSAGGGMPRMSIGAMPQMPRSRDSRGVGADRGGVQGSSGAETADPVVIVQEFSPMPTLARWSEGMRIIVGAQADDRLRLMRAHIVNSLRPAYLVKQEENRKKKAQMDEEKKKSNESLQREQDSGSKAKADGDVADAQSLLATLTQEVGEGSRATNSQTNRENGTVEEEERPSQAETAPAAASSMDSDVEMAEGAHAPSEASAPVRVAVPANLELNSLQQGLEELTSRPDGEVNDGDTSGASMTDAAPSTAAAGAPTEAPAEAPAAPRERVTTTINGNEVDITDSGIDPTFLEALPEDMREEVLNQHFRERRAAEAAARAVAGGGSSTRQESSSIAPEFLEALPPEIRAEVIQQEAVENQRRRREEQRGEDTGARGPSDIDPASFLASLNPDLRGAVLMEQDQSFLNSMPAVMRQEVEEMRNTSQRLADSQRDLHRRYGRNGGLPGLPNLANASSSSRPGQGENAEQSKKPAPRDAIQLLDKAGIAALVRLLFFPQMDSNQSGLRDVLINLSENSKSRHELLNLLLMILAEGTSADSNAVDKSYSNMSVRINKAVLQTPTRPTLKRGNTTPAGPTLSVAAPAATLTPGGAAASSSLPSVIAPLSRAGDEAPFLIASRSIETLLQLTNANEQAAHYFLKDDLSNTGLMKWFKKNSNLKGKEKEKATSNAPINILLVLLGKPSILANAQLVDSLIALLNTVTRPLPSIMANRRRLEDEKRDEEKRNEEKAQEDKGKTEKAVAGEEENNGAVDGKAAVESGNASKTVSQTESSGLPVSAPQISEERMATVVKPLSISISSKGFQHTLAVASNLSTMDGAREVITSALQREANLASKSLISELDDLLDSLPPAAAHKIDDSDEDKDDEIAQEDKEEQRFSSPALTKLASASSSQTVILRSLRALEWVITRPKTAASTNHAGSHQHGHQGHGHTYVTML